MFKGVKTKDLEQTCAKYIHKMGNVKYRCK